MSDGVNVSEPSVLVGALLDAKGTERFQIAKEIVMQSDEVVRDSVLLLAVKVEHGREAEF